MIRLPSLGETDMLSGWRLLRELSNHPKIGPFLPPKWEIIFIFGQKFKRTVSITILHKHIIKALKLNEFILILLYWKDRRCRCAKVNFTSQFRFYFAECLKISLKSQKLVHRCLKNQSLDFSDKLLVFSL